MFKQIFKAKPKWQHPDAKVRTQAVETLAPSEVAVLHAIAREDADPNLRCLAVHKLTDLQIVENLSRDANHPAVRELAQQCYQQLLAGTKDSAASLDSRLARVAAIRDPDFLDYLLREGKESALRIAVLNQFADEARCCELACQDSSSQVRLAALEKITDQTALETVLKANRGRDKRVSRVAKDKLDLILAAQERPKQLRAQREAVSHRLELLLKVADWEKSDSEFNRLQQEWQALDSETASLTPEQQPIADAGICARFAELTARYAQEMQRQQQEQASYASLHLEKDAQITALDELLQQLNDTEQLNAAEAQALEAQLDQAQQTWQQSRLLPEQEEQRKHALFAEKQRLLRRRLRALLHYRTIGEALQALCVEAEKALPRKAALRSGLLEQLQHRRQAIEPADVPNAWIDTLDQRFQQALARLNERLQQQQARQKENQRQLKQQLDALEQALEAGEFQKATALEQQVRDLLKQLQDVPKPKRAEWEARLHACDTKIRELRSWQRWGNRLEREALCEQMEALIGLEADPEALAHRVREAQAVWKNLKDGRPDHALWARFNTACQRVYEPCHAYFAAQAEARQSNHQLRETLCAQLERYVRDTDWKKRDLNWKAAYRIAKEHLKAWHQLGPTDRKLRKILNARFEAALATLDEHLDRERKRNLHQREALIEKARDLLQQSEVQEAIAAVKSLQEQWQITVPSSRKEENTVWQTFRATCDAIFERRNQEREQHAHVLQEHLAEKTALCDKLSALLNDPTAEAAAFPAEIKKAEAAWAAFGAVPKKADRAIENRFHQILGQFQQRHQAWLHDQARAQLDLLAHKAALCAQLESADPSQRDALQEQVHLAWTALPTLVNPQLEQALTQRYTQTRHSAPSTAQSQAARQQRRLLCVRMELLVGQESPAEDASLRMSWQVERLSRAMSGDIELRHQDPAQEAESLIHEWYLCGPVSAGDELEARFNAARQAIGQASQQAAAEVESALDS